jgi:hypothetical protein
MATTIQKAWRKWKMRKHALEQKAAAADLLRGKKERQRDSVSRQFTADYNRYEDNYPLQEAITCMCCSGCCLFSILMMIWMRCCCLFDDWTQQPVR